MKKSLPFALTLSLTVLLTGLLACHKNNTHTNLGIYGQWKWVRTDWTFSVSSNTVYADPLIATTLDINKNGTFIIAQNGRQLADSTYSSAQPCVNNTCDTLLTFHNTYSENASQNYYWLAGDYVATLRHDTLVLTFAGLFTPAGSGSTQYYIAN